ncbi:MAG: MBOAT family O-acyltransferase [Leptospiraceae bacterium]|nr:MBOAT family O-acyltransferase [Leptospiraceae bacterium]
MLFNSISFFLFLTVVFLVYYRRERLFQNYILLAAGIIFYSFNDFKFIFLLIGLILINFYLGRKIFNAKDNRKLILIFGLTINLAVLFLFKYLTFSITMLNDLSSFFSGKNIFSVLPKILLPIGISFYTFHNLSYLIDIYKNRIQPAKSLLTFAIYDLFFPLLLAGPIERAEKLVPQIESVREITSEKFFSGLFLLLYGIFKKTFIADNLILFIEKSMDQSYTVPIGIHYWTILVFPVQLYADFSGYSDCARGVARLLGFELSYNFLHPFISQNPVEFWTRWHISLSNWLRDYLYIPLGGNQLGFLRQNINLFIVWILGGLWHGASYPFLFWGIYCGFQIFVYNLFNKYIISKFKLEFKILRFINPIIIYLLYGLGLILFKVNSISHLVDVLWNLRGFYFNLILLLKIVLLSIPIVFIEFYQIYFQDENFEEILQRKFILLPILILYPLLFMMFSSFEDKEFFYFQF